jgi:hypothetical protein
MELKVGRLSLSIDSGDSSDEDISFQDLNFIEENQLTDFILVLNSQSLCVHKC